MLAFIYRLAREFEQQHGFQPNLLYLNKLHSEHLKTVFSENYSMQNIMEILQMELILDQSVVHPHVAWTHTAQRKMA